MNEWQRNTAKPGDAARFCSIPRALMEWNVFKLSSHLL